MDKVIAGLFLGIGGLFLFAVIWAATALLGGLLVWVVFDNFLAGEYHTKAGAVAFVLPALGYWKSVALFYISGLLFKSTSKSTSSKSD